MKSRGIPTSNAIPQSDEPSRFHRWVGNVWRLIKFIPAQVIMLGVFPAQALSTIKKIPVVSSIVGFIMRRVAKVDSRTAAQTFDEDFVKGIEPQPSAGFFGRVWDFFNKNPKAKPFDTKDLTCTPSKTPYTTNFGRKVHLETFSFENKAFHNMDPNKQYYRIHCGNNTANCSRFFVELATLAKRHPELKTIAYNHPGVEGSGGVVISQDDLVNALCFQVKNLIKEKRVKPENIELSGFSIGAATAAIAAAKLRKEGIIVNLYDDRTFSEMRNVVTNGPGLGLAFNILNAIPFVKELTQSIIRPFVSYVLNSVLWVLNWDMNPATAYKSLDSERKALTVVKPQSNGQGIFKRVGKYLSDFTDFGFLNFIFKRGNADKVIPYHLSLLSGTETDEDQSAWKHKIKALEAHVIVNQGQIKDMKLLENIKPNNSICSDALVRLKIAAAELKSTSEINSASEINSVSEIKSVPEIQSSSKVKSAPESKEEKDPRDNIIEIHNLIALLKVGNKARRFAGTDESNAHNNTSENLTSRVKAEDMEAAYRAAGLKRRKGDLLPYDGITLYSLHHQAIKRVNEREQQKSKQQVGGSPVCSEEFDTQHINELELRY